MQMHGFSFVSIYRAGSLSEKVRAGNPSDGTEKTDADIWFNDWERGGVLLEEARHFPRWDQTLTMLWFEDEEVPPPEARRRGAPRRRGGTGTGGTGRKPSLAKQEPPQVRGKRQN